MNFFLYKLAYLDLELSDRGRKITLENNKHFCYFPSNYDHILHIEFSQLNSTIGLIIRQGEALSPITEHQSYISEKVTKKSQEIKILTEQVQYVKAKLREISKKETLFTEDSSNKPPNS